MSKVFITGCNGYIGSHLAYNLMNQGHEVIGCDLTFRVGHNITKFFHEYYDSDYFINEILKENEPIIYHCAGMADLNYTEKLPEDTMNHNYHYLEYFIEKIYKVKPWIVNLSTCYVYDPSKNINSKNLLVPKSIYGKSKLLAETLLKLYGESNLINYTNFRLFNVYGCNEHLTHTIRPQLISKLILNDIQKKKTIIPTKINVGIRDFVYINDLIDILLTIRENKKTFIVSDKAKMSIHDVVNLYRNNINPNVITPLELKFTHDFSLAKNTKCIQTKTSLLEGMKEFHKTLVDNQ